MRRQLKRHPDSQSSPAAQIEVEIARPGPDRLLFTYTMIGTMSDVRIPLIVTPARGDRLWQHTCFEAFLRAAPGAAYYEFNFAPSTQWAAYRFDGYRSGMRVVNGIETIPIKVASRPDCVTVRATVPLDRLPDLPHMAAWRLGLSAVIEDSAGQISYWALAHPPGKPDFHHADGFAHELSPGAPT